MGRLRLTLPFVSLALAMSLVACGGSEDDEGKIVAVIEASAKSTDPADCKALVTQAFLEQTQQSEGPDALRNCEEDAEEPANDPKEVDVSSVEVDGRRATANARFLGGSFDGQVLSLALIEGRGGWRLDAITGFAEFHQRRLLRSLRRGLETDSGFSADIAACIGDALEKLSQPRLEAVAIGGSPLPIEKIVEGC